MQLFTLNKKLKSISNYLKKKKNKYKKNKMFGLEYWSVKSNKTLILHLITNHKLKSSNKRLTRWDQPYIAFGIWQSIFFITNRNLPLLDLRLNSLFYILKQNFLNFIAVFISIYFKDRSGTGNDVVKSVQRYPNHWGGT